MSNDPARARQAYAQRRLRERQRNGRISLRIDVDEIDLPHALVEAGLLDDRNVESKAAIACAIEALLREWSREREG